jgi:hypothetical protein
MRSTKILPGFWFERLKVNADKAIYHQWEQLNATGCIENFHIAAGRSDSFRQGLFFADSDAYKWLEAAANIWAATSDPRLGSLMDELIVLIGRAQQPDGYLFTYNQIHFPGVRWHNLQVEHELYCHGHLIEAGVSHYQATGRPDLLEIARCAADRVVADFQGREPSFTPGHEEIELALLRLHQVAPNGTAYLEMARQFIEQRGRVPRFGRMVLGQWFDTFKRIGNIQQQARTYAKTHPGFKLPLGTPDNYSKEPRSALLRWIHGILSGKYNQQHQPVREQTEPVGHAVRFGYLETAVAMLARLSGDHSYLPAAARAWESMVDRRMYVTGGLGSVPRLEGFGDDYELDPEYAYAETCAALASMFWNWEMAQLTGEAKYSDLFEWQLYNAAGVGMGLDGERYFYNNPLTCRGEVVRKPWYVVPCCPPNIARTYANLSQYLYAITHNVLMIHQDVSSEMAVEVILPEDGCSAKVEIKMESRLPWDGQVRIEIIKVNHSSPGQAADFEIRLRRPAWARQMSIRINGVMILDEGVTHPSGGVGESKQTACGYDPRRGSFVPVRRTWASGDVIEIGFEIAVERRAAHPSVKGHVGKVALTLGPLVYCLESVDHPGLDIFTARLGDALLEQVWEPDLLGGTVTLKGHTQDGKPLTFIPYFLWGNRGPSQMTIWVNA